MNSDEAKIILLYIVSYKQNALAFRIDPKEKSLQWVE